MPDRTQAATLVGDRLTRASTMVNDAVEVLHRVLQEIKEGPYGDDRYTPGAPVGDDQQPR